MDKDTPEVLVILLDAMKTAFIILLEKAQDRFLELTAALARDDLDRLGPLLDRLVHDTV